MTYNELLNSVKESAPDLKVIAKASAYYRSKFGQDFNMDISGTDEMFLHFYQVIKSIPKEISDDTRCWLNYFKIGERIYSSILDLVVLNDMKSTIRTLDFACGYGRVARFFNEDERFHLVASDIDTKALKYCSETIGIKTVQSSLNPEDTHFDRKFDLIYIISLFSHFGYAPWDGWMKKIISLIDQKGTLLFTYHGVQLLKESEKPLMNLMNKGFYFYPENETLGRLEKDYYGTCYLTSEFLHSYFSQFHELSIRIVEKGIGGMQDVCIVSRK